MGSFFFFPFLRTQGAVARSRSGAVLLFIDEMLTYSTPSPSWFRLRRGSLPLLSAIEPFSESLPLAVASAWAVNVFWRGEIGLYRLEVLYKGPDVPHTGHS